MLSAIKKNVLIILGSLFLAIGFIGVFLPVLPTTPFLLLTVYCYLRSSKKLYNWLMSNKLLGSYIYNYMTYGAVLKSTKVSTMIILWIGLAVSMILVNKVGIISLLAVVGIGVSIHVLTLKTIGKDEIKQYDPNIKHHTENI